MIILITLTMSFTFMIELYNYITISITQKNYLYFNCPHYSLCFEVCWPFVLYTVCYNYYDDTVVGWHGLQDNGNKKDSYEDNVQITC